MSLRTGLAHLKAPASLAAAVLAGVTIAGPAPTIAMPVHYGQSPAPYERSGTQQQRTKRYRLVVIGTLGGPQSFFTFGNANNGGTGVGVADTATNDPFYPNYNPLLGLPADPFVYHAFVWKNGHMTDLGGLPGANSTWASWINENGLVSGQALNGNIDPITGWPEENAVLWSRGRVTNLGTLPGGYESGAGVVNNRGHVAGISSNGVSDQYSMAGLGTQTRGFIWRYGEMHDLGTLGGPDAFAPILNEHDQVIGFSYPSYAPGSCFPLKTDGFVWQNGTMTDLGSFGGTCTFPDAINERGRIVGTSNLSGDDASHAFIWYPKRGLLDLGTLGGSYSEAYNLNENDEAAGYSSIPGDTAVHGVFWNARRRMIDMGTVPGTDCSAALSMNALGQAVGQSWTCYPGTYAAFEWDNGQITDLNVFVPRGMQVDLQEAGFINDRGEIWGNAVLADGNFRTFALIPCGASRTQDESCIEHTASSSAPIRRLQHRRPMSLQIMRGLIRRPFRIPSFPVAGTVPGR